MSAPLPQQHAGGCSTVGLLHRVYTLGAYPAHSRGLIEFDDVRLEMRNSFEALPSSRSSSSATLYQGSTVYPPYRKDDVVASRRKKAERCADVPSSSRRPPLWFSRGISDGDATKWRPSVSTSRLWRHSNARHWYQVVVGWATGVLPQKVDVSAAGVI
ncbi:hypothetical protein FOZ60_007599 [Perkinsus olseni]|uniref:Uncharacterized protein n=1 Tax=Perkinsus olseni TaxID=32597 RepID=A0A7J6PEJ7_PEROL|nr:hypothetical protein FOZ60_007599 [Perkinsus olseni]